MAEPSAWAWPLAILITMAGPIFVTSYGKCILYQNNRNGANFAT